jgi:hypothetical protein
MCSPVLAHSLFAIAHGQPENEVDNNSREQRDCQNRGTKSVIEATLSAHPNTPRAPVECEQRINHSHHSNKGEEPSANLSNSVTEVEKADCEAAEDDGEVEP